MLWRVPECVAFSEKTFLGRHAFITEFSFSLFFVSAWLLHFFQDGKKHNPVLSIIRAIYAEQRISLEKWYSGTFLTV